MKKKENNPKKKKIKPNLLIALTILVLILTSIIILSNNMKLTAKAVQEGCIPNWKCTQFAPQKCPIEGKRTRICTDLNDCGMPQSMPELEEECKTKTNYIILAIIGILLISVLIVLLNILRRVIRIEKQENLERPKVPNKVYKSHADYPSELEQYYASDSTYDLKTPVPEKSEKENLYSEKFPKNYWPE